MRRKNVRFISTVPQWELHICDFYTVFLGNFCWQVFFLFFFFFCLFRAIPTAYADSQARGPIGALPTGLHHSHSHGRSEPVCNLHHSSRQRRILDPLSKARDQTATPWLLGRALSAVPLWELPCSQVFLVQYPDSSANLGLTQP